ncbi:hypothetical protein C5B42_03195 [Candidatus Cerribacteria bacterium 'Amazon FNV 2010 28 9']|uniref:Uncharacterized protein n=1 Tax=Candidatus Cerribacteria bacterium 'Amazon FNV 2010 28 9' TaxID=2081795 RepID=A0A317JNP6_9BACT|nr:MAG: hypothetical protein C5B42_03195 [Candidatus Cerribacteria bacterium 'Amazon FNV 2010 28 9']
MSITWTFVGFEQSSYDAKKHSPTDSDADYMWGLQADGFGTIMGGCSYTKAQPLMQHFKVLSLPQLVGKSFESEKEDASSALDLLLVQLRHGGKYVPPSYESLRERAAQALAQMQAPSYEDVDGETVFNAFYAVWDGWVPNAEWLKSFQQRIWDLSNGEVVLEEATDTKGFVMIKGPAAYFFLKKGEEVCYVDIGPYSNPVSVWVREE